MDDVFSALAHFVVRFRYLVVVFWLAAAVILSATLPSLSSEVNDNNSAFLPASAASNKAANLATPLLGAGASGKISEITIIASRAGQLTSADLAAVTRELALASRVARVRSATLLGISADGEAAQVRLRVQLSQNDIVKDKTTVDDLTATFAHANAPPGLALHLAGQIATLIDNQASSNKAGSKIQGFSFLFIIILLLLVFRSLPAAMVTLLPSGVALVISMRLIGALGAGGLSISSITEELLIVLLLGAGTDYGLFLVFRVREELRNGLEPHDAVIRALVRVGESITASAGTVILALLTLLFASFGLYHDLGVPLAVGVAVMLLIGLTLLPALLAILGRKAFWPSNTAAGTQRDGAWGKVAARLVQRPKATLAVGIVVFLALAAGALSYTSGGFGGSNTAPAGSDAAAGNAAMSTHFPQTASNPANLVFAYPRSVYAYPAPLLTAAASLRSSGQFTQLAGPLVPNGTTLAAAQLTGLHALLGSPARLAALEPAALRARIPAATYNAYRASAEYVSADGRTIQFLAALSAGSQSSTAAMNATPPVRAAVSSAASRSGASDSGVAGEAAALYDISTTANNDLKLIVPIAIVAIGLLLALVLRSLVAPLYLIVSVVLSFLASLGLATIVFMDIGGDSGIIFILPFLMFIFLLALGEDYNILVMTRIREEAHHAPLEEAVVKAITRTGSTVTSAGMILGGTFAVFALVGGGGSGGSQLRAIGFGLAAGILMDTFLVRSLLVPSTVILLGRRNWWPSSLSQEGEIQYRGEPSQRSTSSSSPATESAPS